VIAAGHGKCGDSDAQVGQDLAALPGLVRVTDLASAHRAIDLVGIASRLERGLMHFLRRLICRRNPCDGIENHDDRSPSRTRENDEFGQRSRLRRLECAMQ
jgi:hypothetical protein